jgi:hypothetical protein
VRLCASVRSMTRGKVIEALKQTTINTSLSLVYAEGPLWHEQNITVNIIACGEQGVRLAKFPCGNVFQIPFQDSRVITSITIHTKSTIEVPISLCNTPVDHSSPTIFVDGGSRPNPGNSAAAILVRTKVSPTVYEQTPHSMFYALGTNNIAEGIALLAGIRYAHRMISQGTSHINIVCDSEVTYRMTLGITKCGDKKLEPIFTQIKDAFLPIAGHISLATMRREHGNPADLICSKAILQAKGEGDSSLFIDVPVLPTMPRVQHKPPAASILHPQSIFSTPNNLSEFSNLRRFHTRSRVPDPAVHLWALIVKHYFTMWSTASEKEKHDAAIRILMLPHLFLPKSVTTGRIITHLETAEPFNTSLTNTSHRPRTHHNKHKTTEAITRLVEDRKLHAANRYVHAVADTPDIPFEQKVPLMKQKILEGNFISSIPKQNIPLISSAEVLKAITKANNQASNAVDAWTKDLLLQATSIDNEITNLLGQFLTWLLTDASPHTRSFFLLSRGVAIPKPPSSIRPICISSLFIKLLGSICVARDGNLPSADQYAIGRTEGHKRIIHKILEDMQQHPNTSVLKFDCVNAFGSLPRQVIENQLSTHDASLKQYFRFVYGSPSQVVMFDNTSQTFITIGEGVKQGDATSSLFFCLGLDRALSIIRDATVALGILVKIYAYMDDLTVLCASEHADQVSNIVIKALSQIGLQVNADKSAILSPSPVMCSIPQAPLHKPFVVLGANLSPHPQAKTEFMSTLLSKQQNYFHSLKSLPLHPQVLFTILRICGFPRIAYYCCTSHPDDTGPLTQDFDSTIKRIIELIVDPSGRTTVGAPLIHSVDGVAAPNYHFNRHLLWTSTKTMAITDDPQPPRLSLISEPITTTAGAQTDTRWQYYDAHSTMTPAQFSTALAIHLNVVPSHLSLRGTKCNCGHVYNADEETIEHVLTCDMSTSKTHTHRHDEVKNALAATARWFGLTVTVEPKCFVYDDQTRKRPDLFFHTQPMGIVTDVSLIKSDGNLEGEEKAKTEKHTAAVQKHNCIFIPFIMHTRGTLGCKAETFIRTLAKSVQPHYQKVFSRTINHSAQVAAAKGRADALIAAVDRLRW